MLDDANDGDVITESWSFQRAQFQNFDCRYIQIGSDMS
jgi:hypothetical protein